MFGQVAPTQFDLRFSLFGIPVRVHPFFWLVAALLGLNAMRSGGPPLLATWIACLFASILIHELGHALVAKHYGWPPEIILYHFGGLAVFQPYYGYTPGRSIFLSFAGPLAGFILFGISEGTRYALNSQGIEVHSLVYAAFSYLFFINLIWGLVNLLPVLPLDGGRISQEICQVVNRRRGMEWALKIGIAFSALVGLGFLYLNARILPIGYYPGLLFLFLCFENVQMLQAYNRGGYY